MAAHQRGMKSAGLRNCCSACLESSGRLKRSRSIIPCTSNHGERDDRLNEECLICSAPLVYNDRDEMMTETSKDPIKILEHLMAMPFCHTHVPEHHVLVGAALLSAYRNAGGDIDLESALREMMSRGRSVPGGACGYWGACGAGISSGMFVSVISRSTPLTEEPFALSHKMTARSLGDIGEVGGPRCCKRDSYLAVLAAIDFVQANFGIAMNRSPVISRHASMNSQCIGMRCPFSYSHSAQHA